MWGFPNTGFDYAIGHCFISATFDFSTLVLINILKTTINTLKTTMQPKNYNIIDNLFLLCLHALLCLPILTSLSLWGNYYLEFCMYHYFDILKIYKLTHTKYMKLFLLVLRFYKKVIKLYRWNPDSRKEHSVKSLSLYMMTCRMRQRKTL